MARVYGLHLNALPLFVLRARARVRELPRFLDHLFWVMCRVCRGVSDMLSRMRTLTRTSSHIRPVGNLPIDIRTRDIEDLFFKYGRIRDIDLKAPARSPGNPPLVSPSNVNFSKLFILQFSFLL